MLNGSVMKNLIRFSVPLLLTNWLQLLFNTADRFIVSRWVGSDALAAVGATFPFYIMVICLIGGIGAGVSVCAANDFGAGDDNGLRDTLHTSILFALLFALFMLLLGQGLTRPVMRLLGTPADVVDDSVLYLRIYFLCMPGTLVYMFGASYIRATGDSKRPLMLLAISGASNVVLNMLFVIVFHWGVAGVAIATAITQYLSAVLVVIYLARRRGPSALDLKKLKLHKAKLAKIIRIGLPAGLQSAILASSDMPLQFAVNSLGSLAVAGNSAALTIDGAIFTSMDALCNACTVFTGQNGGAKQFSRMRQVLKDSLILTVAIGFVLGWTGFAFRYNIIGLFLPNAPEAVEYGVSRVSIVSTTCFIYAVLCVLNASLRGYGISTTPAIITLIGIVGFRYTWVLTYFKAHPTIFDLYISYPAAWILCIIITSILYGRLTKKVRLKEKT